MSQPITTNSIFYNFYRAKAHHHKNTASSHDGEEWVFQDNKPLFHTITFSMPSINTTKSSMINWREDTERSRWTTKMMIKKMMQVSNRKKIKKIKKITNPKYNPIWTNLSKIWSNWSSIWRWWPTRWKKSVMMRKKCHLVNLPNLAFWKVMKHWRAWWSKSKIKRDVILSKD